MKSKNEHVVGIKEIARRANVAIATVDRVIHNRYGVSEKNRDKINYIIKELNYQPNLLARRLASRRMYHFAILIPKVSDETNFWAWPLKGIERAEAEISQYGVKIHKYFFDLNKRASFIRQAAVLLKRKLDGIVVAPSFIEESITLTRSCRHSISRVCLSIPTYRIRRTHGTSDHTCFKVVICLHI